MSEYLAGMTARSEHAQMNQSRQPVLDFDRRGVVSKPGWLTQAVSALVQWVRSLLSAQPKIKRYDKTITSTTEMKSLAGGD